MDGIRCESNLQVIVDCLYNYSEHTGEILIYIINHESSAFNTGSIQFGIEILSTVLSIFIKKPN